MVRSPLLLERATSSSSKFLKGGASFRVSYAIFVRRALDFEDQNDVPTRAHVVFGANIASSITMNRYSSLKKVVNVLYAIVTPMRDQQVEGSSEIPTRVVVSSSDSRTIKVQHHTLLFRKRNSNCRARCEMGDTSNFEHSSVTIFTITFREEKRTCLLGDWNSKKL